METGPVVFTCTLYTLRAMQIARNVSTYTQSTLQAVEIIRADATKGDHGTD